MDETRKIYKVMAGEIRDKIEEWLDYGEFNGLGQWRSSGKGTFVWRYVE